MRQRNSLVVVTIILIVVGLLAVVPWPLLAAQYWEVWVVDENGQPVKGITVRETWQNYSVENEGHEDDRQTDDHGYAAFPAHRSHFSILRQMAGALLDLINLGVHASYGRHAHVFAFGNGLEGSPTTFGYVTDWSGTPPIMRSRIVAQPMQLPR